MKYAIISDLHGNVEALRAVLEYIEAEGCESTLCLGDVVGYNANPQQCVDILRRRRIPTVSGNHDEAVYTGQPWGFNPVALSAALWTREQLSDDALRWLEDLPEEIETSDFVAVHGAPGSRDHYLFTWEEVAPLIPPLEERGHSLCFFGHTHSPGIFAGDGVYAVDDSGEFELEPGKTYFINPGSVGQPRDGDARASFGLYDADRRVYTHVRAAYDIEQAARGVHEAGLPPFLAERLTLGR